MLLLRYVMYLLLPVCDEPPVLHGTRTEVGDGGHILFWQRVLHFEEFFKEMQNSRPDFAGKLSLRESIVSSPDTESDIVELRLPVLHVWHQKRQQVRGHSLRQLEVIPQPVFFSFPEKF